MYPTVRGTIYSTEKYKTSYHLGGYSLKIHTSHCFAEAIPLEIGNIFQRSENLLILQELARSMEIKDKLVSSSNKISECKQRKGISLSTDLDNLIRDSIGGIVALSGITYGSSEMYRHGFAIDSAFIATGGFLLLAEVALGRCYDFYIQRRGI